MVRISRVLLIESSKVSANIPAAIPSVAPRNKPMIMMSGLFGNAGLWGIDGALVKT